MISKIIAFSMIFFAMNWASANIGLSVKNTPCNNTCRMHYTRKGHIVLFLENKEKAEITCLSRSRCVPEENLNYTWWRNDALIKQNSRKLIIENVTREDHAGNYTCQSCSVCGCITYTIPLYVIREPLSLRTPLSNKTVKIGEKSTEFHCLANRPSNKVSVEWYPHVEKNFSARHQLMDEDLEKISKTVHSEIYEIWNVTKADEGWYFCQVIYGTEVINSSGYLTVLSMDSNDSNYGFPTSISLLLACFAACVCLLVFFWHVRSSICDGSYNLLY